MKALLTAMAFLSPVLVANTALAQACPGISNSQCRATPPSGNLLHKNNSKGFPVWTTDCNRPNSAGLELDPICHQIANCTVSGAFGKFLQSVTFDCKGKHFEGYFGLDGMTFGILDWTQDNLPRVLQAYQRRNGERYQELFGNLNIPSKNGCVDERWACESNRQARLTCDPAFHNAFAKSLSEPDFKKAQIDVALDAYEGRLKKFSSLGLKSEYGNVAMIVVANNLRPIPQCRPAAWKASCTSTRNEKDLVDCMLDQYIEHRCRGTGSLQGVIERVDAIKSAFAGAPESTTIHPTADQILSCVSN